MYHESIVAGRCRVQLTCDAKPECSAMVTAFGSSFIAAQDELLRLGWGWGLYKTRQLCPKHVAQLKKHWRTKERIQA